MAHAIGRSMDAVVAVERYLWLTLSGIKEKEKSFLPSATVSPSGLFDIAVDMVVEWFR